MSANRRDRSGDSGRHPRRSHRNPRAGTPFGRVRPIVAVGVIAAALGLWVFASRGQASHHPEPRPGVTAADVVPASRYAEYPRVAQVYRQAAEVPAVLDGLYCYCDCAKHSGHRSLLDCFKSDHGAGCDVCLSQAALAHRMARDGEDLDAIRTTTDHVFAR